MQIFRIFSLLVLTLFASVWAETYRYEFVKEITLIESVNFTIYGNFVIKTTEKQESLKLLETQKEQIYELLSSEKQQIINKIYIDKIVELKTYEGLVEQIHEYLEKLQLFIVQST